MKNVASVFTTDELAFIESCTGVMLTDEKDYSGDELLDLQEQICDEAPDLTARIFENVIDKLYDHFNV